MAYSNLSGTLNASPDFLTRLNNALRSVGLRGSIPDPLGGYRTGAQEDHLHSTGNLGQGGLVGTSSTSMHVFGWASDVLVGGRPIKEVVPDHVLARFGLIAPYGNDTVHVEDRRGLSWAKSHAYSPGGGGSYSWKSCTLTWYDPALGGTNSGSGRADPTSPTSSGEPYNAHAFTCAAPATYPFGTKLIFRYRKRTVTCKVNDRGGAITGAHFDLSRAAAQSLGIINAGKVSAEFAQVGAGQSAGGGAGVTRPGGSDNAGQGLETLYKSFLDEGQKGDRAFASFVTTPGNKGKAATRMVSDLILPGVGPIPGTGELLQGFDPFDLFKQGINAIQTTQDLLKLIGWIFNPRNILRMVEFAVGLSLIYIAVRVHLRVFADSASEQAERIIGSAKRGKRKVGKGARRSRDALTTLRKQRAAVTGGQSKPKPKQLGSGASSKAATASRGGRLASAAGKAKTIAKLVPK